MALDALSDGFVRVCIDPSANWLGEGARILVEGQFTGAGVLPDVIVPVTGTRRIDADFGAGSVLAETLKVVFESSKGAASIYALPRADAADGVKAAYTLTVTGPATSDGRVTLYLGEARYSIDVGVDEGDTAETIAALVEESIPASFPYAVTVGADADANILTFTARNAGTVGNGLTVIYNWAGRSNYAPSGVTLAWAQTVQGANDPVPAAGNYASIIRECAYAIYILSSGNEQWQRRLRDHLRDAWDCTKPQSFGHGYVYSKGLLGSVLADGDNSAELSRLAVPLDEEVLPYLLNAAYGGLTAYTLQSNPELSIQGRDNGLLSAIRKPQSCSSAWEWGESENLREQGFVVYGPSTVGVGQFVNPFIYNDVTNYLYDELGRDNYTFRDTNQRRLTVSTTVAFAQELQKYNGLALFTQNTTIREGIRGTNVNLITSDMRAWATSNVGVLFSEFVDLDSAIRFVTDFQVQPACVGKPGVLHAFFDFRPPVRIDRVNATLRPGLLDNCDR